MLDRVGTLSFSQGLVNEYGRIQGRSVKWQTQISTGKVGDNLTDVKDKASVLVAAKQKSAGVDSFLSASKEVLNRLDVQDIHMRELVDISSRLRQAVSDAISTGHAPAMMDDVKNLYGQAVAIVNARIDGKYLYGGSRTDVAPVSATDLSSLVAAPSVDSVFNNSDFEQTQRIDENETITVGLTASNVATDLFQMFKDIGAFDAGVNGPFGSDLNAAQTSFLTTQNVALPAVHEGLTTIAALNGSRHSQVTATVDRHESMSAYFTKFIGDIEDVDLSAAIAKLNQDQVAAQASGRMIAQLNQISLLNFLPAL
ncbi:MAG: flagellin [Micropepsaceae bacterium]